MGTEALEKAKNISYQLRRRFYEQAKLIRQSFDQKIELLTAAANAIGYIPNIEKKDINKLLHSLFLIALIKIN